MLALIVITGLILLACWFCYLWQGEVQAKEESDYRLGRLQHVIETTDMTIKQREIQLVDLGHKVAQLEHDALASKKIIRGQRAALQVLKAKAEGGMVE